MMHPPRIVSDPTHREVESQNDKPLEMNWINSKGEEIYLLVPKTVYPPREDTELLDLCISKIGNGNGRKLLEIGCGSGALSISAANNGWRVTACDINPLAVVATKGNAERNKVKLELFEGGLDESNSNSDFLHHFENDGPFDLIVWNLPYLSPPLEGEPRLGPLEDAGLIDSEGNEGWGEILLNLINQKPTLLKKGGAIYLLHTNNPRGNLLQSTWRQSLWATRIVGENDLADGERITCFSAWKPFQNKSIEWHDELGSTNLFIINQSKEIGDSVIAKTQTQGRGQRDREWITKEGDFAGSWLLDPKLYDNRIGVIQLSAALSVIDTYCTITNLPLASSHWINCAAIGRQGISIHWPNDVWAEEGKIAGCLIEGRQVGEKQKLVLGIGVNLQSEYEQNFPICGLREIVDKDISLEEFAELLNCSISSLFELHALAPKINPHFNSIWQLMSKHLSIGKGLIQNGEKMTVNSINEEGELLCHDGKEVKIVRNSFTREWV